jgi:hypothetical protein
LIAEEWFGHGTIRCGISYEQGVKAERERIIELLESRKQHEALARIDQSVYRLNLMLDATIALIKGEK